MKNQINRVITRMITDMKLKILILITNSPMSSSDLIIEYSSNPPNKGILEHADIRYRETNRVCADIVEVSLIIRDGRLTTFMFDGYMSIVATACVSITGELLE